MQGSLPPKWPDNFGKFEGCFLEVSDPQIKDAWGLFVLCVCAFAKERREASIRLNRLSICVGEAGKYISGFNTAQPMLHGDPKHIIFQIRPV